MDCFPGDIEAKLGFDVVRARLADLAGTELGRSRCEVIGPLTHRDEIEAQLDRVLEWVLSIASGDSQGLGAVPDLSGVLERIAPAGSWVTPDEAVEVVDALRTARLVKSFFAARTEMYPVSAADAAKLTENAGLESWIDGLFDETGRLADSASAELRRIRKETRATENRLRRAAAQSLRQAQEGKTAAGDEPTIRAGRTVIPLKAEVRRKADGLVVDTSASGQTVFVEPSACVELNNELRLLEGQERRETVRILTELTDDIRLSRSELRENQRLLVEMDTVRAFARLSRELECTRPIISDGRIALRSARNPALTLLRSRSESGSPPNPVVPLDLALDQDRVLLISGPNAGGKSVAMKTVGLLSVMLAHGLPLPVAEASTLPLFERVLVDIGDEQSMESDLSTFSSHLAGLKHIVSVADERTLVLVDEIGTATDPSAGQAIAQAVLEALVASRAVAIITTHYGDLKAFADQSDGALNGAMRFDRDSLAPTYVFERGVPGSSFAFQIAERSGFPSEILERAQEIAGDEESRLEALIADLESARIESDAKLAALRNELGAAEAARKEAESARRAVEDGREARLAEAEAKAAELLRRANRTIENTIREIKESQADRERTRQARNQLESLREHVQKRVEKRPAKVAGPTSVGQLQPGDRVTLDDGTAVGEVVSLSGSKATVAFGSMQTRVRRDRLRKVGGRQKQEVRVSTAAPSGASGVVVGVSQRIDLRGHRVVEAIPKVDRFVDQAVRGGLRRVEILHGTGTGALRNALHEHLRTMADVEAVREAPMDEGGAGVSIVDLR